VLSSPPALAERSNTANGELGPVRLQRRNTRSLYLAESMLHAVASEQELMFNGDTSNGDGHDDSSEEISGSPVTGKEVSRVRLAGQGIISSVTQRDADEDEHEHFADQSEVGDEDHDDTDVRSGDDPAREGNLFFQKKRVSSTRREVGSELLMDDEDDSEMEIGYDSSVSNKLLMRAKSTENAIQFKDELEMIDYDVMKRKTQLKTSKKLDRPSLRKGRLWTIRVLLFPFYVTWWSSRLDPSWLIASLSIYLMQLCASLWYLLGKGEDSEVTKYEVKATLCLFFVVAALLGHCAAVSSAVGAALKEERMEFSSNLHDNISSHDIGSSRSLRYDTDVEEDDDDDLSELSDDETEDSALESVGTERFGSEKRKSLKRLPSRSRSSPTVQASEKKENHSLRNLDFGVSDSDATSKIPTPVPSESAKALEHACIEKENLGVSDPLTRKFQFMTSKRAGLPRSTKYASAKSVLVSTIGAEDSTLTVAEVRDAIYERIEASKPSTFYTQLADSSAIFLALFPVLFRVASNAFPWLCKSSSASSFLIVDQTTIQSICILVASEWLNQFQNFSENDGVSVNNSRRCFRDNDIQCEKAPAELFIETSIENFDRRAAFISVSSMLASLYLLAIFFQFVTIAEESFRRRLMYAKYFAKLTSSGRAKKARLPHFRLNKVNHIRVWLELRHNPREAHNSNYQFGDAAANTLVVVTLTVVAYVCLRLFSGAWSGTRVDDWATLVYAACLSAFMYRFVNLASYTQKKYNAGPRILYTEQLNIYIRLFSNPQNREELIACNNMIKIAVKMLSSEIKPGKDAYKALLLNPVVYNLFRVTILSAIGTMSSDVLGFKIRLWKL